MRRALMLSIAGLCASCGSSAPMGLGSWVTLAEQMNAPRIDHRSALVGASEVLIAGDDASSEVWDRTARTFTVVGPSVAKRGGPALAVLVGGGVMMVGGAGAGDSAETYHPGTKAWTATGPLPDPYIEAAAAPLDAGSAMVLGGNLEGGWRGVLLWELVSRNWGVAPPMAAGRIRPTATRMLDGRVLVAGGNNKTSWVAEAEIFDPQKRQFSSGGMMPTPVKRHEATLLASGDVLVTGGLAAGDVPAETIQLFHSGAWSKVGELRLARYSHTATLLGDGRVLICGGLVQGELATNECEYFDPMSRQVSRAPKLHVPRAKHAATALANGTEVLITGGQGPMDRSAELFTPEL